MENENNKLEMLRAEEEKARLAWNAARKALDERLKAEKELKVNPYLAEAFEKAQDSDDAHRFYENGGLDDFEKAQVESLNYEISEHMRKNGISPAPTSDDPEDEGVNKNKPEEDKDVAEEENFEEEECEDLAIRDDSLDLEGEPVTDEEMGFEY